MANIYTYDDCPIYKWKHPDEIQNGDECDKCGIDPCPYDIFDDAFKKALNTIGDYLNE